MEIIPIERGWAVYSEDDKRVGDIVEVHPHYLLVSRGVLVVRDVYVPRYAVATVEEHKVRLAISAERLRKMGWTSPPPVPPSPIDSPSPRLVPPAEPDEYGPPPLTFRDETDQLTGETPDTDTAAPDSEYFSGYEPAPDLDDFDDYVDMGMLFGATIEIDGSAYIAVQRLGEGPAIVFVHGWGLDHRVWEYLTLDLPRDHTVVTYDNRGYGGSSAPWDEYSIERASRDLRVVLRTLDLRDATVVGLDLGAAAALHYALNGGRRAGRLVLIAPTLPAPTADTDDADDVALPQPLRAWQDGLRGDRPRLAADLAGSWAPATSPQTQAWLRDALMAAAPYALLQGLPALAHPDLMGALEDVALPVRVLLGRDDPLVALEPAEAALGAIPGVEIVYLDLAGHLPMITDPTRIAAEIRAAIQASDSTPMDTAEPSVDTVKAPAGMDESSVDGYEPPADTAEAPPGPA